MELPKLRPPGPHEFSTDAAGVTKTEYSVWGVCVSGKMAHGTSFEDKIVSISPLEKLGLAAAVKLASAHKLIARRALSKRSTAAEPTRARCSQSCDKRWK